VPALAQPLKNFKNIDIVLPPIDIQKRIASILSSLDDKIENNRRINENLEQQAQALFKSWFVDFEPFKDGEFVESDLGMIPTGWRVEQFKDICENITDGVHNSIKDDLSGNYYLLSCKNIKGGFVTIGESERKINKETFEKLRKRTRLQKGDILLSSVGTVGEMVLLNEPPYNYEFQRSVAIIKPNTNLISSHFLYYAMKAQRDEIIHSAHGAVQQCLFISDVANFKTIYPTHEIMQSFTNIVIGLHDKISQNQRESRRLASLRDTLLPKLMSGELKVDEINL
jgi:type I restriction enzyme S subunit